MNDGTIIRVIELPEGQDWAWFAEENVLALGRHLDVEGQLRAVDELQAEWRAALPAIPHVVSDVA